MRFRSQDGDEKLKDSNMKESTAFSMPSTEAQKRPMTDQNMKTFHVACRLNEALEWVCGFERGEFSGLSSSLDISFTPHVDHIRQSTEKKEVKK